MRVAWESLEATRAAVTHGGECESDYHRGMAELINFRIARKRAKRRDEDVCAAGNRFAHGQPKSQRELAAAKKEKAKQALDRHRIDKGGDR